jgi:hypothetical protein
MRRRAIATFAVAGIPFLMACGAGPVANRCPDVAVPRCVTPLVCAMDGARGCQVCHCESPPYTPIEQKPP